jgi:nitroreductase
MPYLDAGVIIQTVYLATEALNIGCCYVNPNIREENKEFFKKRFKIEGDVLFCGALVLGKYNLKHK